VQDDKVVSFNDGVTTEQLVVASPGDRPRATGPAFALEDVRLVIPYRPRAVFMVGANYAQHVADAAKVGNKAGPMNEGEIPCLLKGPGSPIGPFDQIVRPPAITALDYEGELMAIVGHDGKPGGYAVANDVSARDVGDKWQLTRHKGGDTFCPWGPWVTTADEIDDPYSLQIRTWVDGELRQNGSTNEGIVRVPEILEYISKTITPRPGDGLLTGTCAGTIAEMSDPIWLQPGNRARIEIEGLGTIENEVIAGS
jgi:2-keto-4-pentenoate hydratase/2-oxohepta-3-ene-1,7-dioic acid hydratase in catechol pathway